MGRPGAARDSRFAPKCACRSRRRTNTGRPQTPARDPRNSLPRENSPPAAPNFVRLRALSAHSGAKFRTTLTPDLGRSPAIPHPTLSGCPLELTPDSYPRPKGDARPPPESYPSASPQRRAHQEGVPSLRVITKRQMAIAAQYCESQQKTTTLSRTRPGIQTEVRRIWWVASVLGPLWTVTVQDPGAWRRSEVAFVRAASAKWRPQRRRHRHLTLGRRRRR